MSNRAELTELLQRIEAKIASPGQFDASRILFKQQLPFGLDDARYQTVVTPRRAGKTFGIAVKLLGTALRRAGSTALYITLSRLNAKRIVWETLKQLNAEHELGGEVLEADLCIRLPNGSRVYLSGANDRGEVEKFRGMALSIVVIDEAQSFPAFIGQLVDEVLAPALTDFAGIIVLVGTPGPVPIGYFYEKTQSAEWKHHGWSVFDNIHLERKSGRPTLELLADELKRRGVTQDDPVIQREWFGRWALDLNSLVFRFSPENGRPAPRCTSFVLAGDVGFDDADALAVLGWNDDSPLLYLVEEFVMAKQTITGLAAKTKELWDKYQPLACVFDMGGLGKKIAVEVSQRTGIPIEAAEKERKLEHIELLNDALRTFQFFAPKDSRFAQDCMKVEWDKSNPEKPKISARFHSDICDAVLYGWRRCLQWLYSPPQVPPAKPGTPEYAEEVLRLSKEAEETQMQAEFDANAREKEERDESWL